MEVKGGSGLRETLHTRCKQSLIKTGAACGNLSNGHIQPIAPASSAGLHAFNGAVLVLEKFRRHVRLPVWLVLLALLLQLPATAGHLAAMAVVAPGMPSAGLMGAGLRPGLSLSLFNADGSQTLVICTASGIRRVTLGPDGEILDEKDGLPAPDTTAQLCHITCTLSYRCADAIPGNGVVVPLPRRLLPRILQAANGITAVVRHPYLTPQNRAPPPTEPTANVAIVVSEIIV